MLAQQLARQKLQSDDQEQELQHQHVRPALLHQQQEEVKKPKTPVQRFQVNPFKHGVLTRTMAKQARALESAQEDAGSELDLSPSDYIGME